MVDFRAEVAHCRETRCGQDCVESLWREVRMRHAAQALVLLVIVAVPAYAGAQSTLTPEPATIGLVATGVAFLGGVAWWRSRKK